MTQEEKFKTFAEKFNAILAELKELSNSFDNLHAIHINVAIQNSKDGEETGWDCQSMGIVNDKFDVKLADGTIPNNNAITANFIGLLKDPNASHYVASALKYVTKEHMEEMQKKRGENGESAEIVELN